MIYFYRQASAKKPLITLLTDLFHGSMPDLPKMRRLFLRRGEDIRQFLGTDMYNTAKTSWSAAWEVPRNAVLGWGFVAETPCRRNGMFNLQLLGMFRETVGMERSICVHEARGVD